jgi:anaerobic magnesium-protoporphyrin IX monomethyl ester cyclase
MPDLLLTHGYFLHEDPKELQIMKPYPPLGILYLCSHLRARGFSVDVHDSTFSTQEALHARLREQQPSVLGVYANLMTRPKVVNILAEARRNGWRTIVGGPEPGAYVEEYLRAGAEVVVLGEGEITMEELLPLMLAGGAQHLDDVRGIAFLNGNEEVVRTPPRLQIQDLDAQPWPDREAIDTGRYVETWRTHHGMGSISLITARGCPFRCEWCSHQVYGQTHRRRKPQFVADELEWLKQRYKPDMLWVADDVFTINHAWLEEWREQVTSRSLHIPFECISRADRLTEDVIRTLAELGCFRLWIGSESGSQRILDRMQRGVTIESVQKATKLCRDYGIKTGMFLMWGYEGEELDDIEATIEHVRASKPDVFLTTVSYPIKGTPYFKRVEEQGRIRATKPWAESSDRELEIVGRRSGEFYQIANQLLKHEVELALMTAQMDPTQQLQADSLRTQIANERMSMHSSALTAERSI